MSSTSFDSAVQALVQIHDEQINHLQQQIANLRNPASSLGSDVAEEYLMPSGLHHDPAGATTPGFMVSTPNGASTPEHCAFTPRQGGLDSPVYEFRMTFPRCQEAMLVSKPRAAERSTAVSEPCGCDEFDGQHSDDGQDPPPKILQQWITLAQFLLHGRDCACIVRPGWLRTSFKSSTKSYGATEIHTMLDIILNNAFAKPRSNGVAASFWAETLQKSATSQRFHQCLLVSHPESFLRRTWTVLSLLVILYEVVALTMAPFEALGQDESIVLETASAIFWISDVVLTFLTGIYIHGKLEMRLHIIAKRYLCTWFAFDFTVAAMQVLAIFRGGSSTSGTLFKVIRVVRVLRCGRMLSWVQKACAKVLSERASSLGSKVAQCLATLYFFVHLNACLWYEIGKSSNGWISEYNKVMDSVGAKYLVAMHWSLAQLQGNVDVYPGSAINDRLYVVVSSFASIIFLALLVSGMTDALLTARDERKVLLKQRRMVDSFFLRHHIKPALRGRAKYYLKARQNAEHSIGYEDQDRQALEIFPPQLRWRLLAESRTPILKGHPVFCYLRDFHMAFFARICTDAIFWHSYEPEDDIFMSCTNSIGAYYIASGEFVFNPKLDLHCVMNPWLGGIIESQTGSLQDARMSRTSGRSSQSHQSSYSLGENELLEKIRTHSSRKIAASVTRLFTGQLVTEVSLWTPWTHAGDMSAVSHGQCFSIRWSELVMILEQNSEPYDLCSSYAALFVKATTRLRENGVPHQEVELMGCADVLSKGGRGMSNDPCEFTKQTKVEE